MFYVHQYLPDTASLSAEGLNEKFDYSLLSSLMKTKIHQVSDKSNLL